MKIAFFAAVSFDSVLGGRTRRLADILARSHQVHFIEIPSLRRPSFYRVDQPVANVFRYKLSPLPGILHEIAFSRQCWSRIAVEFLHRFLPMDAHAVVSTPFWLPVIKQLRFKSVTYDCLDHIRVQLPNCSLQTALKLEQELVGISDRLFCVSKKLVSHWEACCGKIVHFVPNGAPESYLQLPLQYPDTPTVGFCGALYEWLDYSLLEQTVSALSAIPFSFTGPVRNKQAIARLSKFPNVTIRPAIPFDQVPCEMQKYSVGLIPFVKNDISFFCNPLKIYEYLALGKPVLSTVPGEDDLPVTYANSTEDFISHLEKLLVNTVSGEICRKAVSPFTWERIASQIERLLQ